jgi:hypothetical protein
MAGRSPAGRKADRQEPKQSSWQEMIFRPRRSQARPASPGGTPRTGHGQGGGARDPTVLGRRGKRTLKLGWRRQGHENRSSFRVRATWPGDPVQSGSRERAPAQQDVTGCGSCPSTGGASVPRRHPRPARVAPEPDSRPLLIQRGFSPGSSLGTPRHYRNDALLSVPPGRHHGRQNKRHESDGC